ncbi:hypothetical protein GCM10027063_40430 [Promicromonospora xylanilytica]
MIFHDRVQLQTSNAGVEWSPAGTWPAEVRPLKGDEQISAGRDAVITRYRVFISKHSPLGTDSHHVAIVWQGAQFLMDGGVEIVTRNGRVQHYAFLVKAVSG